MKAKDIIVIFQEKGLILDTQEIRGKGYDHTELLTDFAKAPYKTLFYFGFADEHSDMSVSLSFLHSICQKFIGVISNDPDVEITKTVKILDNAMLSEMLYAVPYVVGEEYISIEWLTDFWTELTNVFEQEIAAWNGTVGSFLTTYNAKLNIAGRVFFHLVENKSEEYPFAFLATYSTETANKAVDMPLKNALVEYKDSQDLLLKLLATVSRAADRSNFISELVESGELFSPLQFDIDEAYTFLKEIPLYEECGIICRMPDWWKKKSGGLRLSISIGGKEPAVVGMEALVSCKPSLILDGQELSKEELEVLLSQAAGLTFLKGKWIEVDHHKLNAALEAFEKVENMGDMTLAEAMRMELGIAQNGLPEIGDTVEITNGEWLQTLRYQLTNPTQLGKLKLGADFHATLRHYQQDGFHWLALMKSIGFGALLADDMGLGKTVQIIALLEYFRQQGKYKALLIIPASLIGNWQKELDRFAPNIHYAVLHAKNTEINDEVDLFITTYGMARRLEHLNNQRWDLLILDEAQAIKNPGTAQTKAIKQLDASFKIAMTGTPIENKLADLWSLFDFLNAGLLGTAKEFSTYAKNIKENGSYAKLRNVVNPFILRRLKTDKSIINDLPDKVEIKAYTTLTSKQAILYRGLVQDLEHQLETTEGIQRKGMVLAAITKFKQICNHPDQYLGQSTYKNTASGKFEKLQEICETIYEKRERVLVFTQFKEMTEPLADFLSLIFERKGLVLHGGTTAKKRTEMVEQFNGVDYVPFMVLSLKAGGVGLNLTAANHVIHFDRWWNPAVENQATDRAFRIGQTKNVMVHKFITAGTIEEKIDAMIAEKQQLSGDIIAATGEQWITEMSNDELMQLFTLEV
ncbi:DEAD/DEAH box helicase [Lysinibacillus macroides]|uniref:Helicase SNF2 n=1 Tax=Lysinibacillus macroides TaxID=33935 RepID=A0A0M9DL38_9BACI|nr:DEAD/DEAH box helicase [Lysinibacillus macroides]KOY83638.1 helicase SNF2 [Lysinibacillus macroides]QPR66432.1 DEAD/DEAH box helicase [Lysinibacillus macroides]